MRINFFLFSLFKNIVFVCFSLFSVGKLGMGTIFLLFSLFLKKKLYFFIDLGWVTWYDYGNQFSFFVFIFFKHCLCFFIVFGICHLVG